MSMYPMPGETVAFITTVGENHFLAVPDSIPTGATVAIVMVSRNGNHLTAPTDETVRQAHFNAIMEAIRSVAGKPAPADQYTNAELDAIIEQARKTHQN